MTSDKHNSESCTCARDAEDTDVKALKDLGQFVLLDTKTI